MAATRLMIAVCALVVALAAAGAAAQRSGNLAFLAPVHELPGLAKPEPADVLAVHGRSLGEFYGDDDDHEGRNHGRDSDPARSAWDARTKRASDMVFAQGVASGDPFAKSVILWTRATPPSGQKNKAAFLDYAVARDRKFRKIVTRGTTITNADVDFTAKVEARKLKPNTKYFYQWRYRQNDRTEPVYSAIGATRTLPRRDDDISCFRIAFFGCSNLPEGFFTAYGQIARMAQRGDVDLLIHTGDYIYEYQTNGSSNILDPALRKTRTHQPDKEILTLSDYRIRHNQYNSDIDTKAMRASAPLIPIWDDHEYANDAWKGGAQNHQPATEGDWNERRLRALQVYYEMMPIRQANADNKQQIYRNFEIGKLIKLIMLDTRVIGRDLQNGTDRFNPNRTILGPAQKQYLKDQLSAAEGSHTWKIIGQQVVFARNCAFSAASFFSDMWEGYRQDQDDVLRHLAENKIDNTVVLTGDIHTHWAFELPRYPCKAEKEYAGYNETGNGSLAVEFVSSSITSNYSPVRDPNNPFAAILAQVVAANPHVKYLEPFYKGFAVLDVRRKHTTSTWYFAPNLQVPGQYNTMVQGESWRVNVGTNKLTKVQ